MHAGQATTSTATGTRSALPLADACCAPLLREPITASQVAGLARLIKALAHSTRLQLVSMDLHPRQAGVWAYYSLVPAALDGRSAVLRTTR